MARRNGVLILLASALFAFSPVAAACSSNDGQSSSPSVSEAEHGGGTTVGATMEDFSIALDTATATSGEVTFDITNDGPSLHEFVVLRTDLAADALPVEGNVVPEDAEGVVNAGEAEDIASGATATLALNLDPGSYALVCNIPEHYGLGMHASFTVS